MRFNIFKKKVKANSTTICTICNRNITNEIKIYEFQEWRCSPCSQKQWVFGENLR